MRNRILILVAVIAGAAIGALYGGVFRDRTSAASAALAGAQATEDFKAGFALNASTASLIADLQSRLRVSPKDEHSYTLLGLAYQQRARETGDPSWYTKSDGVLRRALALDSKDYLAVGGLGSLALSRHRFGDALSLGEQALELNKYSARTYGVIGDALIELGRYRQAFATFDRMTAVRPSLASYARVAYARELIGDRSGAAAAMQLALDAAGGSPEPTAWAHVELAKLALGDGRIGSASEHVRAALAIFPGYVLALEQEARVDAARGRLGAAIVTARRAATAVPLPQFVALLGDLLERQGHAAAAARQRATIMAIDRVLAANGLRVDLEAAVFRADHDIRPVETVRLARRARADRPSIYGDDALGWALARAGRCAEAEPWLDRALRLGTKDALLYFHRGYAAGCAGDGRAMRAWYRRALEQSPAFSVRWAPVARGALE